MFDPWVGKGPWRRKWQPTLVFLPGKSHIERILGDCSPRRQRHNLATKQQHDPIDVYYKKNRFIYEDHANF